MLKILDKVRDKEYRVEGSFGKYVYLVRDPVTDVHYACKKVNARKKFKTEVGILTMLTHPNIVQLFCSFHNQSNRYILLEACSNGSLQDMLKSRKKLSHPEVRCLIRQVVSGVEFIHDALIVHRNLHLSSILLSNAMIVKIGCFGYAAMLKDSSDKIKRAGWEEESFVAPEMLSRTGHGLSSDIWSVGCITYTILVGKPPFVGETSAEVRDKILQGNFTEKLKVGKTASIFLRSVLEVNSDLRPPAKSILDFDYFREGFAPPELTSMTLKTRPTYEKLMKGVDAIQREPLIERTNSTTNLLLKPKEESIVNKGKENVNTDNDKPKKKPKCRKQPKVSQRKNLCIDCKQLDALNSLLHTIKIILKENKQTSESCPETTVQPFLCVSCWAAVTNGGGFGYHLSDGTIGIHFADGTHLLRRVGGTFLYMTEEGNIYFGTKEIPIHLESKVKYMRLIDTRLHQLAWSGSPVSWTNLDYAPYCYVVNWKHYSEAIAMIISNGSLQVNFEDHIKFVFNEESNILNILSETESGKNYTVYHLENLKKYGIPNEYTDKLNFVLKTIRDFKSCRRLFCECV